jgi:phospholipase/carboxylesterase
MADVTGGVGRHAGQTVARIGPPVTEAAGALILLHGRGGHADGMLDLARLLVGPEVACLAPRAAGHVWYPRRFIEPIAGNEPDLSSALSVVESLVRGLRDSGIAAGRIGLAGFSQGACLALEFTRRVGGVGGVLGFSGGLIGEGPGQPGAADALAGVPVFLGCSERDPHIPLSRVHETATVLTAMGAEVTTRIIPGAGHAVTEDEVVAGRLLLARLIAG